MGLLNGKHMFINNLLIDKVEVDACNTGAGMAFRSNWLYINWKLDWGEASNLHINYKETLAIVGAAKRWASLWSNSVVIIKTDNQCAKQVINKGTTKNKFIMAQLRELFWLSVLYNFEIKCIYIPGINNCLPDAISRLHEKGQFLRAESLLSERLHVMIPTGLRFHMSKASINFLILQIIQWLHSKPSWTLRFPIFAA